MTVTSLTSTWTDCRLGPLNSEKASLRGKTMKRQKERRMKTLDKTEALENKAKGA
jgi:hypothetical protein